METRDYLVGLLIECPLGNPKHDCPLEDVRKKLKTLKERLAWIKKLSDEQVEEIISHHKKCLKKREH